MNLEARIEELSSEAAATQTERGVYMTNSTIKQLITDVLEYVKPPHAVDEHDSCYRKTMSRMEAKQRELGL